MCIFLHKCFTRVFLVEFACNMVDFHAWNTSVMLQCPWPVLYITQQRLVINSFPSFDGPKWWRSSGEQVLWKHTFYSAVFIETTPCQCRQLKQNPLSMQINICCLMTNQMPALLLQCTLSLYFSHLPPQGCQPPTSSNIENWWGRDDRWHHNARHMTSFVKKMHQ